MRRRKRRRRRMRRRRRRRRMRMRIRMRWHALCGERMVMIFALHAGPEDASSMDEFCKS